MPEELREQSSESIRLSNPQDLRDRYPEAGWVSARGSSPAMPEYKDVILSSEILGIVREIAQRVEAAIKENKVEIRQPQTIRDRRSLSFAIPITLETSHLQGWKRRIPKPGRKEIIDLYKKAGWHSVDIANPTWRREETNRTLTVRLTYWQDLPPDSNTEAAA